MKGFLIQPTYRVENGSAYVYLYGRQEDGKTFLTRNRFRAYFHIKVIQKEDAKKLFPELETSAGPKDFNDEPLITITLDDPKAVPDIRDALEDAGIATYEADVRFTTRFLIDKGIQGSLEIDGQAQPHPFADCFYDEPALTGADYAPKNLKMLSIDIETGDKGRTLYCISLAGSDGWNTVLMVSENPIEGVQSMPSEHACLETFMALVREYDPDIITGWNLIDYDLKTLQLLCQRHHVPFVLGRSDECSRIKLEKQFFRDSSADAMGRAVLDGIALLKINFVKLDDYKLETAAQEILGESKLLNGKDKQREIDEVYANDRKKLADYCRKDAQLVLDIIDTKQLLALMVQRSILTGMPLERVKASIASLDSLYLRALRGRGYAARTYVPVDKDQALTGGYVMESKPGIYDYVIVCDFKSLYPSVIRSLNIDPLSYLPNAHRGASDEKYVVAENGAVFRNTTGILPEILDKLHEAREEAKAAKNPVAVNAIKIVMNSFWGSIGSSQSRYFSLALGNAITLTCQHIIKHTAELLREKGYDVIYGDTDSLFIDLKINNLEGALKIGQTIPPLVNEHLESYIKKRYHRKSQLEIQLDKVFVRFFLPMTRGGEGSKKRYAGLRIVAGREQIDFTGLEFVRRDWTELAKEFQLGILQRVFDKQDPSEFVREYVADLKAGKKDDMLVYRKAIRKDLKAYTKTTPQHVKAARQLGELTSNLIEYYVTVDGPQPVEKCTSPIDYEHYINKQLRPLADSILVFYGVNFDDLVAGSTQRDLFSF